MFNCIFGDQVKKQNFSTFHMRILEIQELFSSSHHLTPQSADVILVQAETIKSFTIFFTYVLDYYADAKQSALEIRIPFFFFMVVANCNASCYWLHVHCSQCQLLLFFHADSRLHLSQHGRFHAVSFETASQDAQTLNCLNWSRNVNKFYACQVVSLINEHGKPKFVAKADPLSTDKVDRAR